MVRKKEVH